MTHESKNDAFLEKVILFLVIVVGAVLIFNQFQYADLQSNILLNALSFLLILVLIGLVVWLFIQKKLYKGEQLSAHEHHKKYEKKPFSFMEQLSWSFVVLIAILIFFNQFQIAQVNALVSGTSGTSSSISSFVKSVSSPLKLNSGKSGVVIGPQLNSDGRTTKLVEWSTISETPAPKSTGNPSQDAIAAVVPTGTPF